MSLSKCAQIKTEEKCCNMVIFNKTENITKTNCKIAYKVYRSLKMDKDYFLTSKKMLTDVKGPIIIYAYTNIIFCSDN